MVSRRAEQKKEHTVKIKKAGFAPIELLVVVTILTLLGAILFGAIQVGKSSRNVPAAASPQNSQPSTVKHLHVISAYNGQCIIHSAIHGDAEIFGREMGATRRPWYLKWCDIHGASHELYVSDLTVIHISSDPMELKGDPLHEKAGPKLEADK